MPQFQLISLLAALVLTVALLFPICLRPASKREGIPGMLPIRLPMALFLFAAAVQAPAQEPYVPKPVDEPGVVLVPFKDTNRGLRFDAAAQFLMARDPMTILALRMVASEGVLTE